MKTEQSSCDDRPELIINDQLEPKIDIGAGWSLPARDSDRIEPFAYSPLRQA